MEPISIPANSAVYKTGALMLLAGGVPVADALFLIHVGAMQSAAAFPIVFMLAMGCFGIAVGVADLAKWRRAKTTPALRLTDAGITDATGCVTGGFVSWSEVRSVSKVWLRDHHALAIQLFDNDAYLARLPAWKRSLLASNIAAFGTPCLVSEVELAITIDQAKAAIEGAHGDATRPAVTQAPSEPPAHWWTAVPPEERAVVPLRNGR